MAKKSKKVTKKATPSRTSKRQHHHWEHHDFLLVLGGGFVVIAIIFLMSGSFGTSLRSLHGTEQRADVAENSTNVLEETVLIQEFSYSENPLVVKKGTTVTWTNNDTVTHSALADDGSFNTGELEEGESGSVTFNEVGEYTYHSAQYPSVTGTVIVEE